jgi:Transposase DDE domain
LSLPDKKGIKMHPHIDKFSRNYGNYRASVIKNLFIFVGCIIQGKTVNIYNLRDETGKLSEKYKTQPESHYKRLTRFLLLNSAGDLWLSILCYGLDLLDQKITISYLDATEWKIGTFKLHILMLCADYEGVAIPLYFQIYNHKGVLSESARIQFLANACKNSCLQSMTIVADREFIGTKWFCNFQELNLTFIIRLRQGIYKDKLVNNLSYLKLQKRANKKGKASARIKIEHQMFRLWVIKNRNKTAGEPLIYVLTNILDKRNTPNLYRLRWKIECLFKHMKTNGYNLEDLRITNLSKIRLILSMLVLAYILAILTALDERKNKKVIRKYYADGRCFDSISVFKQGQSLLKQNFISLRRLLDLIQFLNVSIKAPLPFNKAFVQ